MLEAGRTLKLEKYNGTTWDLLTTFTIGSTGTTFTYDVNSSSATILRVSTPSAAVYVHDIIVGLYSSSNTITTSAITGSPFCAGSSVSVPFTITGTFTGSNVFTAQLSNSSGGFASPVSLGTLTQTTAGTISGTIPSGTATGSGYRIRVIGDSPSTTGTDNGTNLTINTDLAASVSIAANPSGAICSGTSVTFTATPSNGGAGPTYQWKLNGTNVGTDATTYTNTTLSNSDLVTCVMTSNATCVTGSPATSNTYTTVISAPVTPSVSIGVTPSSTACSGTSVTFTVTPTNGGTPAYQWKNGAANVGTNSNVYTVSTLANDDIISCVMTATGCVSPSTATSGNITMTINTTPSTPTAGNDGAVCAGSTLSLTSNATGTISWTGPNSFTASTTNTSIASATTAATGTYSVTSTVSCCTSIAGTTAATVNPLPVITSALTASGTTSSAFSYTITASGTPTSYSASGLPAGLSLSGAIISGTPSATGTTNVTINAINACGTGSNTLVITITSVPVPEITSFLAWSDTTGNVFSYTIIASNTPTSYNATGLPTGLNINTTTGVISGTPTTAATTNVTISATNSGGSGSATLVITITTIAYVNNDYRSTSSGFWGGSTPLATWERLVSGVWTAGLTPSTSCTNNVYIFHDISTFGSIGPDKVYVHQGGSYTIASASCSVHDQLIIENGATFTVNASFTMGDASSPDNFEIKDNGTVNLNFKFANPSTSIWAGTENFHPNSNVVILDWSNATYFLPATTNITTNTYSGYTAMFGNFIVDMFNSTNTSAFDMFVTDITANLTHQDLIFRTSAPIATHRFTAAGNMTSGVGRDLITESTFTSNINLTQTGSMIFTVKRDLIHGDGKALRVLTTATSAPTSTLNVEGNISITGSSTLSMNASGPGLATSIIIFLIFYLYGVL